jgi:LysR family cyn operon transcriptional activator
MTTGELNIGVTFSFSSVVSETMLDFYKMYPGIKINVMYTHMSKLIDELLKHNLDIVLAFKPSDSNPNIESEILFNSHLAAIVNEYHPLVGRQSVTLSELSRYNLALPSRGLQARNAFEDIIAGKDYAFRVKLEINNIHMLFRLIRSTQFVTVLSESTVINEQGVTAVKIDEPGNVMVGCIHTLKDAYLKASAKEFVKMLRHSTALLHNAV